MPGSPTTRARSLAGGLWLCALGVSLLVSARATLRRSDAFPEFAHGCDSFGYLTMAREVRRARVQGGLPDFHMRTPRPGLLAAHLASRGVALPLWDELVAPHAHHWFPAARQVGPQYPPGTAALLALFPEGRAVHGLNRAVLAILLAAGAALLAWAGARRAWAAAGFVALALHVGMSMLGRTGNDSYSVNAVLAPLLVAAVAAFGARALARGGRRRAAGGLALAAGLALGFAILVRIPVALLVPGFAVLLVGARPGLFGAGLLAGGVLPLLVHQDRVAGLWLLSTYGGGDHSLPTLVPFLRNLDHYLGSGVPTADNWGLAALAVGSLALGRGGAGARWGRAALVLWGLPAAYFLTHSVTTSYYAIPATFATAATLALVALERGAAAGWVRRALAFTPGIAFLAHLWLVSPATSPVDRPAAPPRVELPAEVDGRSWIWADALSGSIWYYTGIPAFKITFSAPETRALVQDFVAARGERQYLVEDSPGMVEAREEIVRRGGVCEPLGAVVGHPIFRVTWPPPAVR